MGYFLLLDNGEFVSYEEVEDGFEITPQRYWFAYEFETREEAKIEKARIKNGKDEDGKRYYSNNEVVNIVKIEDVTKEDIGDYPSGLASWKVGYKKESDGSFTWINGSNKEDRRNG